MPLTDNYDGTLAGTITLSVVTADGAGTTVPIHGIEGLKPPDRSHKRDVYTPISGTRSNKEQLVLCSESAGEITGTLTYEAEHQVAMDAICGTNACQITLTYADGSVLTGRGGIEKIGVSRMEDSRHMQTEITIALCAGWTYVDGDAVTVVEAYTVTTAAGVATIDLTACGSGGTVNLTGKLVSKFVFTAPAGNGAVINIDVGASNGYDIGGAMTITLDAGQSVTIEGTAASDEVDATHKILDVTGTGVDDVSVYIEAIPA